MAVFVDPKTGERFENVPDAEAERARSEFGLVDAEAFERQKAIDAKPLGQKTLETVGSGLAGVAAIGNVIGDVIPEALGGYSDEEVQKFNTEFLQSPLVKGLKEEHPIAFSLGSSAPAIALGPAVGAAAGGGLLGGVTGALAESAAVGSGDEAIASGAEGRAFDEGRAVEGAQTDLAFSAVAQTLLGMVGRVGNLFLFGGGNTMAKNVGRGLDETVGPVVPDDIRFESPLLEAETRSTRAAAAASPGMPPGPARDEALRRAASDLNEQVRTQGGETLETTVAEAQKSASVADSPVVQRRIDEILTETTPAQTSWSADATQQLDKMRQAAAADPAAARAVAVADEAIRAIDGASDSAEWFKASAAARDRLDAIADALPESPVSKTIADARDWLGKSLADRGMWGTAADLDASLQGAARDKVATAARTVGGDLRGHVAAYVDADGAGRAGLRAPIDLAIDGIEELAAAHERFGTATPKQIEALRENAAGLRRRIALADDVRAAEGRAAQQVAKETPEKATMVEQAAEAVASHLEKGGKAALSAGIGRALTTIADFTGIPGTGWVAKKIRGKVGDVVADQIIAAAKKYDPASPGGKRVKRIMDRMRAAERQRGAVTLGGKKTSGALENGMADAEYDAKLAAFRARRAKKAPEPKPKETVLDNGMTEAEFEAKMAAFKARRAAPATAASPAAADPKVAPTQMPKDMGGRGRDAYASPEELRQARIKAESFLYSLDEYKDQMNAKNFRDALERESSGMATDADRRTDAIKDEMFATSGVTWSWTGQALQRGSASADGAAILEKIRKRGASEAAVVQDAPKTKTKKDAVEGPVDFLQTKLGKAAGSTEGGMYRGSDGVDRYAKFMREADALNEAATARAYSDLGVEHMQHSTMKGGSEGGVLLSEKLGDEWVPLHEHAGPVSPEMAKQWLRGIPADIVLGNVDRALNSGNVMTNGKSILRIDAGVAGPYVLEAPVMRHQTSVKGMWDELLDPVMSGSSPGLDDGPRAIAPAGGVASLEAAQQSLRDGVEGIQKGLAGAGGTKAFVAKNYPHLSGPEQAAFARQIDQRLKAVKSNVDRIARGMAEQGFIALDNSGPNFTIGDIIKNPAGVVTGAGAAWVGINQLRKRDEDLETADRVVAVDDAAQQRVRHTARVLAGLAEPPPAEGLTTALGRFGADHEDPRAAFEERKGILEKAATAPTLVYDVIGSALGDVARVSPELFQAASQRLLEGFQYLRDNLPAEVKTSMLYPTGVPPSESAMRDWATQWNTVMNPESVLDDIERGTVSHLQIRTLEGAHPDIYQSMRTEVIAEVGANFQDIPWSTKMSLDLLFQADGLAGPMFSSKAAAMIGEAMQNASQRKAPGPVDPSAGDAAADGPSGLNAIKSSVTNRGA